jgi:hypothetical protein
MPENAIFTLKIAFSGVVYFLFIARQHFGSNPDDFYSVVSMSDA